MLIDCDKFTPTQIYFLLIQTVIPRPIAWVLSDNGNNTYNLAPFSFFNAIASNPPMIMLSVGWKDDVTRKDTWVNIEERKDFVVHIPSGQDAAQVADSSITLPHGISEVDHLNMSFEKVEGQLLPRVKGPLAALFCEKYAIHEIGDDRQGLILGKVNSFWLSDDVATNIDGRFTVDQAKLDPLARLGGSDYALLGEILKFKRPD